MTVRFNLQKIHGMISKKEPINEDISTRFGPSGLSSGYIFISVNFINSNTAYTGLKCNP